MYKNVKYLLPAEDVDTGGITLKQPFPTNNIPQIDPFLLLHHANFQYHNNAPAMQQGIGVHPHRGFTPVSFVIKGEVHHRDSRGNNQIAKAGEVQWMHAGFGIVHSERPSQALVEKEGKQELIQLWINSPASRKMQPPLYQFVSEAEIPVFLSEDKKIVNKLIAGNFKNLQGKITTESDLLIIWGKTDVKSSQRISIPKKYKTMLYLISGKIVLTKYGIVAEKNLVVFENNATDIEMSIENNAAFLLLCGVPIEEPVIQQGPFVMNSELEIMTAMRDYQMGKMGILIEE